MDQIKHVWEVIKAFFANEAHLAEAYRQEQIDMYAQWYDVPPEALKDPKVTIVTPALRRRLRNWKDMKRAEARKRARK